jgi:MFS family permease
VSRLTAANNLARLSVSMLSLSLLVAVTQVHGYAAAGLLMLVYAITNAAAGPVRGRLADRFRPRIVLLWLLAVHVVAFVLLYAALSATMAVLVVACVLLGASVPPTGPVVRGLWPVLIPKEHLATAYAFDSALNNATFVAGPVLAGVLLLALPAQVAVAVTGLVKVTGDALVATAPEVRTMPVHQRQVAHLLGPLVHGRVRLLLTLMLLDTFTYGCLEVAAVAAASGQGSAGVLTGLLALGAVVSGLAYGARTWPGIAGSQLVVLTGAGVVVLAAGAGLTGMVLAGAVFAAFGLVNGPVETVKQVLIGEGSPAHQRVEVFSWVFSVMWLGFGLGTTVAGLVSSAGETGPALMVATGAQLLAVALTAAWLRNAAFAD